jgi:hypothetical protein
MIFGNIDVFAIECEITQIIDRWIYGRFRVWVNGIKIGSYSEEVLTLLGTTGVLRNSVPELSASHMKSSSEEILFNTREVFFGCDGYSEEAHSEWAKYAWLFNSEGFETIFSVIFKFGENVKIIWCNEPELLTNEFFFTNSAYLNTSTNFLVWLSNIKTENC